MYKQHWGLDARPFENTGRTRDYYPSEIHQTALLKLRYALEHRRAAALLAGESGMGKTMLTDALADGLPEALGPIVRVVFPQLPGDQLVGYLADELTGSVGPADEATRQSLRRIDTFLAENASAGRHAVVIVDEAHLLTGSDQLETLRLLLNLQASREDYESAWTLVLVGQSTLPGLVERHRALDERTAVKCILPRLSGDQTSAYVQHRLAACGGDVDRIFTPSALETLHLRSCGIPRRINRLADLALMVGYAEELTRIDAAQIDGVHEELIAVPG